MADRSDRTLAFVISEHTIVYNDEGKSHDISIATITTSEDLAIALVKQFNAKFGVEEISRDETPLYFDYQKYSITGSLQEPIPNNKKTGDMVEFQITSIKPYDTEFLSNHWIEVEMTAFGFEPTTTLARKDRYKIGDKIHLKVDCTWPFWQIQNGRLVEIRCVKRPDLIGPRLYPIEPDKPKESTKSKPSLGDLSSFC